MSYSIIGYGATYSAPVASKLATRMALAVRKTPPSGEPPPSDDRCVILAGMMDPGAITPERCAAAGCWWDTVAQRCLNKAPPLPADQPDPTVPPPPVPPPPAEPSPDPAQACAEAGGCWDPVLMDCFVCMDEEGEPSPPPPVVAEPAPAEDDTAMYAGIALLLAAGLAGGYFLISRKKKKGKP